MKDEKENSGCRQPTLYHFYALEGRLLFLADPQAGPLTRGCIGCVSCNPDLPSGVRHLCGLGWSDGLIEKGDPQWLHRDLQVLLILDQVDLLA